MPPAKPLVVGVLAFQGDVAEHRRAPLSMRVASGMPT